MTIETAASDDRDDLQRLNEAVEWLLREQGFAIDNGEGNIVGTVSDPDILARCAQLIEDATEAIATGRRQEQAWQTVLGVEDEALARASKTLFRFAREVRFPDEWRDLVSDPLEVGEERVRLGACTADDLQAWADVERRRASHQFVWASTACDGADLLIRWMRREGVERVEDFQTDDEMWEEAHPENSFEPEEDADDYSERRFTAERYNALGLAILKASGHPTARVGSQPSPPPEGATSEAVTRALRLLDGLYFFDREAIGEALNLKTVQSAADVHRFAHELIEWAMTEGGPA